MFPDADKVVIDRKENRHAAFGLGIHRCVGSNLARMEMTVAIEEWLKRIPEFSARPGRPGQMVGGHRARAAAVAGAVRETGLRRSPRRPTCYHARRRRCRRQRDGTNDGRSRRTAAGLETDAQQAALGAGGPLPHRQDRPTRRAAPAAGTASDAGLADARPRPDAEHFQRSAGGSTSTARSRTRCSGICRQFTAQPQTKFVSDIHCVTTWSRYDNHWEGVSTRDLLDACRPRDEARFVVLHSHDGYTTNLTLEISPPRTRCSRIAGRASRWSRNTAARCGWSCRTSISGRAPNGCSSIEFRPTMRRASGKSAAITIEATRGKRNAIPVTRACPQLSQMIAAARWIAARKFLAVLS